MYSRDVEYILAIYEERSVTKAAAKLFLTQSALSRYIINLEKRLGEPIFDRNTTPISLTPYGQAYVETAIKMRCLGRELENRRADYRNLEFGKVRIGIPQLRGDIYLPTLLPKFKAMYPGLELEIEVGSSIYLEECLLGGKADFIVLNGPLVLNPDECEVDVLATETLSIATPPGLLPGAGNAYTFAYLREHLDLNEQNYVLLRPDQRMRHLADRILRENAIAPKSVLVVGNLATANNLVASGMGLTVVNEIVQRATRNGVTPDYYPLGEKYQMDVIIARRRGAYFSGGAREFIQLIKEEYGTRDNG